MKVFSFEDVLEAISRTVDYALKSNITEDEKVTCLAILGVLSATMEDLPVYNAADNKESV